MKYSHSHWTTTLTMIMQFYQTSGISSKKPPIFHHSIMPLSISIPAASSCPSRDVKSIRCNCEGPNRLWLWNCLSKVVSGQELQKPQHNCAKRRISKATDDRFNRFCIHQILKVKPHNKYEKHFGYPKRYPKHHFRNIDFRYLKHFAF